MDHEFKVRTSRRLAETELWPGARDIIHFIGICGAGKSTLSSRLAARVARFGGKAIGTIDYDPHTPDHQRANERAFSRELDQLNIAAGCTDPAIHQHIVDHTLSMLEQWMQSDANVVLVDRWYESYDGLPPEHVAYIEAAIQSSGFRVHHVMLVVAESVFGNEEEVIRQRMLHTKGTRPEEWWASGPDSLDTWVREEQAYQDQYRLFVHRSPFPFYSFTTLGMDWPDYEQRVAEYMIEDRWFAAQRRAEKMTEMTPLQQLDNLLENAPAEQPI